MDKLLPGLVNEASLGPVGYDGAAWNTLDQAQGVGRCSVRLDQLLKVGFDYIG